MLAYVATYSAEKQRALQAPVGCADRPISILLIGLSLGVIMVGVIMAMTSLGNQTMKLQLIRTVRRQSGFTLLEMLVVLMIIGLLVSMVGPRLFSKVNSAKVQTAAAQIKLLRGAVETMRMDINVYPTQEQGLRLLTEAPSDPALKATLERPLSGGSGAARPVGKCLSVCHLQVSGQPFTLISLGADGKPGGEGNDADVGVDQLSGKSAGQAQN